MSKFRVCVAVAIVIAALSVSAFAQAPAAPPAFRVVPPAPAEKVLATVGDDTITSTQVDMGVRSYLRGQQAPPEALENLRKMVLDSMIESRLVSQFVAAKKVVVDAKEVEEMIARIKTQVADAGIEFADVLKAQGLTEETLRSQISSQMAIEKYAKAEVTDEKAETHYNAHKAEFDGSRVKASHILLKYDVSSSEEEKKAANDKIALIRQEIVAGGDFAEAAKKHSECPSSDQGGDLGFFEKGQMVKPFSDAAFGMTAGQLSQPVETQFGIHLIKVTGIAPTNFEEAKDEVKDALFQQVLEQAAAEQRKVTKVEIAE